MGSDAKRAQTDIFEAAKKRIIESSTKYAAGMDMAEVPESESDHKGNEMVIEERPWIAAISGQR